MKSKHVFRKTRLTVYAVELLMKFGLNGVSTLLATRHRFLALSISFMLVGDSFGQETRIISPPIAAIEEGDFNSDPACCGPFRYQEIFASDDFLSLFQGSGLLTQLAWRPDGLLVNEPRTVNNGTVQIFMSYTSRAPNNISSVFGENIESEQIKVFDGILDQHTDNRGPVGGPKEADYLVTLDVPFLFETGRGNLLIDYTFADGLSPSNLADRFTTPPRSVFADLGDDSGFVIGPLVHEFTFVPIPEPPSVVLCFGCLSLLSLIRRRELRVATPMQ